MGCISKLGKAVLYNCDNGATGISEMLLINMADVATKGFGSGNGVVSLTLNSGAKAILVEANKKGVNATEELKTNDNAPTALTQGVTFTIYNKTETGTLIVNSILNGTFIALCKLKEGTIVRAYGVGYGLVATAVSEDANANGGYTTITLSTPENVIGELRYTFGTEAYATLRAAAIVAE